MTNEVHPNKVHNEGDAAPVHYRPKNLAQRLPDAATPEEEAPPVWMIKRDGIDFLFSSIEAAKRSIVQSYPDHVVVESHASEGMMVYDVAFDGRIQDRVTLTKCNVNSNPVVFRRTEKRSTAEF
jgi:hypothetical protein